MEYIANNKQIAHIAIFFSIRYILSKSINPIGKSNILKTQAQLFSKRKRATGFSSAARPQNDTTLIV
jgi:hypothetical protein